MSIRLVPFAVCMAVTLSVSALYADTIQLINGDRIKGQVVSLDEKQLVLKSESFGELKIPRAKIELVSLGDKGIPNFTQPVVVAPKAGETSQGLGGIQNLAPMMQDPAVQQQMGPMIQQLLGPKGGSDTQENIEKARRGMKALRKDLGEGPEGEALDAYIKFFEHIAPVAGSLREAPQQLPEHSRRKPLVRPKATEKPAEKVPATKSSADEKKTEAKAQPEAPKTDQK